MEAYIIITLGALFSGTSGYITWLSWRDARMAFNLIAKLDSKIYGLQKEVETLKSNDQEQILKS
jgi:hypothetical protein